MNQVVSFGFFDEADEVHISVCLSQSLRESGRFVRSNIILGIALIMVPSQSLRESGRFVLGTGGLLCLNKNLSQSLRESGRFVRDTRKLSIRKYDQSQSLRESGRFVHITTRQSAGAGGVAIPS